MQSEIEWNLILYGSNRSVIVHDAPQIFRENRVYRELACRASLQMSSQNTTRDKPIR